YEKNLPELRQDLIENAFIGNESYIWTPWNFHKGDIVGQNPDGTAKFSGDVDPQILPAFQVARDIFSPKGTQQWAIITTYVNKYDLAAQYMSVPELYEKVCNIPRSTVPGYWGPNMQRLLNTNEDIVPVHVCYHERSPACPSGLEVMVLDRDCILPAAPLGYDRIPLFRCSVSDVVTTELGYSSLNDILGLNDALDSLVSTVLTNQMFSGVLNLVNRSGNGFDVQSLGTAMNLITVDKDPPVALQMPSVSPDVFNTIGMITQWMQQILGQNPVSLGQVDPSSRLSTQSMSILEQKAVQHMSRLASSTTKALEGAMSSMLQSYQRYVDTPRVMRILGSSGKTHVFSFTGADVENIDRVMVDSSNPALDSTAARYDLAMIGLQTGAIRNLPQAAEVLTTGTIKPATDGPMNIAIGVQKENEMLMRGEVPLVSVIDDPMYHVQSHAYQAALPEVRDNPKIMMAHMEHLTQHLSVGRSVPPELAALLGHTPIPPIPQAPQGEQENGPASNPNPASEPGPSGPAEPTGPGIPE
ncbi:MAG: hypothetical protein MN733_38195, partial [Nitrososphaera sp.]|nr:hypothetical protein [Nitrososphaera sp.]